MTVVFDKLAFTRRLEQGGTFGRDQAEALSDAFHDAVMETVATKQDVEGVQTGLKHEITEFRTDVKHEFAAVRAEIKHEIAEFRTDVKHEFVAVRAEIKHEIGELRAEVKHDIAELRLDTRAQIAEMKVWVAGAAVVIISVLSAVRFFGH